MSPTLNELRIDLSAIAYNLALLQDHAGVEHRLMPIIKANGYGTNGFRLAEYLTAHCKAQILGVAHIEEAIALREQGMRTSLFVIHAAPFEAEQTVRYGVEIGVSGMEQLDALETHASRQGRPCKVHLHIDTGMNRLGCRPEHAPVLAERISRSPFLHLEGVMTHFAAADDPREDPFTASQLDRFGKAVQAIKERGITFPYTHAANSSGVIRLILPDELNMSRIGLALFGVCNRREIHPILPLRPALELSTKITAINLCRKGETIGYGRKYPVARERAKIAILPFGYQDGLSRVYKGDVVIREKRAPVAGLACMDYMMVDITQIPEAKTGDEAQIFGDQIPVETAAENAGLIPHELIAGIGPRVRRLWQTPAASTLCQTEKSHMHAGP